MTAREYFTKVLSAEDEVAFTRAAWDGGFVAQDLSHQAAVTLELEVKDESFTDKTSQDVPEGPWGHHNGRVRQEAVPREEALPSGTTGRQERDASGAAH